ncbi:MAG: Short-chain dehydrogenase [Verrucomicrobiaceae bacterium]|nr:Short-chain dehydrogenase [Verrucomicrobiaceae bacterium]
MQPASGSSISGKKIIIAGGTSGMGQAMVEAFPALGAQVIFFGRSVDKGNALARSSGARFIEADVADEDSIKSAIERAVAELGGLDVLITAAGVAPGAAAENITLADWLEVMAINVTGTYLTNTIAFPHLKEHGGTILNFSSAGGIQGYAGKAHYAASKGAVVAWTRSLAKEWGRYNIRVNAIAPAIWTPMYDKTRASMSAEQLDQHDRMMLGAVPLGGKLGNVTDDFLPVMRFLCSDDAKFMTGQVFAIDGGVLMLR